MGFYWQAVNGHLGLMAQRQDVSQLINDKNTSSVLREKLVLLEQARNFASETLQLADNQSYRSYVQLDADYVTWNVVAAPEFSVQAKTWCFLFAGCVPYRGYFAAEDAQAFAAELQQQGFDVTVNGVAAYSTLGWFDDPILSSMLKWSDARLVGILFHELAHQKLWVDDDTAFNEAFAQFIEQQGVRVWLRSQQDVSALEAYHQRLLRQRQFVDLLRNSRTALHELYQSHVSVKAMRLGKQQLMDELKAHYQLKLKPSWDGYDGYDHWFLTSPNNAKFALLATYNDWLPAFELLYSRLNQDLSLFYAEVQRLSELEKTEREQVLINLSNHR